MVAKVLSLNPNMIKPPFMGGLVATDWDSNSFWMAETFSFTQVFSSMSDKDLSPFMMIDSRLSFLLSLLDQNQSTCLSGIPSLACLLFMLRSTQDLFKCDADITKYWNEYSERSLPQVYPGLFSQLVTLDSASDIDFHQLEKSCTIYLASFDRQSEIIAGFKIEKEWLFAADSDIGVFFVIKLIR